MGLEWVLIAVFAVGIVAMMFISGKKNKKSQDSYLEMINTLEKGDKVYLTSRIVAVITKIITEADGQKFILVESGEGENKSNFLVDVQAVYTVLTKANAPIAKVEEAPVGEEKTEEVGEQTEEKTEEVKAEQAE